MACVTLLLVSTLFATAFCWNCNSGDEFEKYNTTFDLCPLQLTALSQLPYYEVFDNSSKPGVQNYSYVFNIANNLQAYPEPDKFPVCYNNTLRERLSLPEGYCETEPCPPNDLIYITSPTAAYQIDRLSSRHPKPEDKYCYRLHNGHTPPKWSLIDETDPISGVMLTYIDGDYCSPVESNRELRLRFVCSDRANNLPDREEAIVEEPTCVYTVNIPSIHGCPAECPTMDGQLCAGNGICEFDFTSNQPKCFCFSGRYGDDCTLKKDPDLKTITTNNDDAYVGGLVVVVLLLIIVLCILGYLFFKLQQIKTSPQMAFNRIKESFLKSNQKEDQQRVQDMNRTIELDSVDQPGNTDDSGL